MTNNSDPKNLNAAGRDELIGGLFGINFSALRSIWVLFRKPSEYFEAAKTANWDNKYTPAITLALVLAAILVATEYIWVEPNSAFVQQISKADKAAFLRGAQEAGLDIKDISYDFSKDASTLVKRMNMLLTPVSILLLALLALVYKAWGATYPYAVRLRYLFALIIPASVFNIFWIIGMTPFSGQTYNVLMIIQIPLILLLYFATAFRGAFYNQPRAEAIMRSLSLTATLFTLTFIATLIAIFIAGQFFMTAEKEAAIQAIMEELNGKQ